LSSSNTNVAYMHSVNGPLATEWILLLYRNRRTYCEKNAGDRAALHSNGKLPFHHITNT